LVALRARLYQRITHMPPLKYCQNFYMLPVLSQCGKMLSAIALLLATAGTSTSWAFDIGSYKARADTTLAELDPRNLPDSKATLARLDEMIAIGIVGMKEYSEREPRYAKLMEAAIADSQAMKIMTDAELEEKWGENRYGGDAVGVPLKSLNEFGTPRAYLELIVAPAEQYIYIRKWQSAKKARWLEQARNEAVELSKHRAPSMNRDPMNKDKRSKHQHKAAARGI
jgi:hypothetical protein